MTLADVAVIGGSGFYSFLEDTHDVDVETPYGAPSAPISLGTLADRRVAFLPRHGRGHEYPPHRINYRANLWALASLGVRQVLAPCAVGGMGPTVRPGDLVVPDQLVDRTHARAATYVETGAVHVPFADPYCARVSGALASADPDVRIGGTMVVIEGPRFSTRAESQHHAAQGWSLVNMTGQPEAVLARELRLCYAPLALVTDMDAGEGEGEGVSQAEVFALFARNLDRLGALLTRAVAALPDPGGCACSTWADDVEPDVWDPRTAMRVLLTGSAGFIGTAIDRQLVDEGHEVVCVDAMLSQAHGISEAPPGTHRLDVRDADGWRALLRGIDVVCHQAAVVGAGVTVADLPLYAAHNDLGTAALLAAMHAEGVRRLVLASSMVVYGEGRYACAEQGAATRRREDGRGTRRGRLRQPLLRLRQGSRMGDRARERPGRPALELCGE